MSTRLAVLAALVRREGPGYPVLVLDLDQLDDNLAWVRARFPRGKAARLVAKSLPSSPLVAHALAALGTHRQMVFHAPFLLAAARDTPTSELLLGKPMPARAAAGFYRDLPRGAFDPARQLIWLVDTAARAAEYAELARGLGVRARVAVELDIGLHRGGAATPAELAPILRVLAAPDAPLELAGFMGYDAHVGAVPRVLGEPQEQLAAANARYRELLGAARELAPALCAGPLIVNGAGSKTFLDHDDKSPVNDLSFGSALVKPTRFDVPALAALAPAVFIATPVLKVLPGTTLPGLEWARGLMGHLRRDQRRSAFIYGGRFDATFVWPEGTREDRLYGASYNQSMIHVPEDADLAVDDQVLLRPNDSEAVMLQFGDLWVVRGGALHARWPVLA